MKRRRTGRSDSDGGSPSTEDATTTPHPQQPIGSQKWSNEVRGRELVPTNLCESMQLQCVGWVCGACCAGPPLAFPRFPQRIGSFHPDCCHFRGLFVWQEDARLVELVKEYGTLGKWHLIGQHLGGRNARQCRERCVPNPKAAPFAVSHAVACVIYPPWSLLVDGAISWIPL